MGCSPILEVKFLDPAVGSGHFLLEAFDLFYLMYEAEGRLTEPEDICAAILNHNLYGIDIDERAVQIATAALWMKAKEKAPNLEPSYINEFPDHLIATNIRLPKGKNHLQAFLKVYPDDKPLLPALETVFEGLSNVHQLGSLLQIEEPVEKELRYLKSQEEIVFSKDTQLNLFAPTAVQTELPFGVESYDDWKEKTLIRLKEHFNQEAEAADLSQAFFSQSAGKGLALFDLLAKRYDVVAANPPYMGSKNMGDMIKRYVFKQYLSGKRDLYAAFILRCRELAREGGRVAMVTQQSWMFQSSYADLRALEEEKINKESKEDFTGLLRKTSIETLAHLGSNAFNEISGEVVNSVIFVFNNEVNSSKHKLTAFRLIAYKTPDEKDMQLRLSIKNSIIEGHKPYQVNLIKLMDAPVLYWLPDKIIQILLSENKLGLQANVIEGLHTGCNQRFIRFCWENNCKHRWFPYEKAGEFCRWFGLDYYSVDWEYNGTRIKIYNAKAPGGRILGESFYFKSGLTYSFMGRGSIGVRLMSEGRIFDSAAHAIFSKDDIYYIQGFLNTYLASFLVRTITQSLRLNRGYVANIPFIKIDSASDIVNCCNYYKYQLELNNILSSECVYNKQKDKYYIESILLASQAANEFEYLSSFNILPNSSDFKLITDETGTPAGFFPLITNYDTLPELPPELPEIPQELIEYLQKHQRLNPSPQQLNDIKRRLRNLYETGPGAKIEEEEIDTNTPTEDEEEETEIAVGAHIPIPTETFLEELSVKLEIHPISVYWLLKQGREQENWRCLPEEKRFTEDTFTVIILRLLGHRWPKQIEAGEPVPQWADKDGIIPLTIGTNETPLIERVRDRITAEFADSNLNTVEREFAEIVGISLEKWLTGAFYKRHISQFKKRPIAWQIESIPALRGKGKGNKTQLPAFSCLVYYHQLDGDLLPKLRTQYIGPLRSRYEVELNTLENITTGDRTPDQAARILELQNSIEELKTFDQKLNEVAIKGFCPEDNKTLKTRFQQVAIEDATLCLKSQWLRKLEETLQPQITTWKQTAARTKLNADFPQWIETAFTKLEYLCNSVGEKIPDIKEFTTEPTSTDLAKIISKNPQLMFKQTLKLACNRWWIEFNQTLLVPCKEQIKAYQEENKQLKEEWDNLGTDSTNPRVVEIKNRQATLKKDIKDLKTEVEEINNTGEKIREQIENHECPEIFLWEQWLSSQPIYDIISSLDGKRNPPQTIAEFITQESAYVPDLNDGVRVNITPLQKAGLLASEVIAKKDIDKAISDRVEWRADERRWCREGKLPQPGWWR
ncbi:N-6 DNA methylase [Aphanizomenon sp. PH219]|nr:N-6 DNA methylase [Aphanizomenon sp. 202]MDK2458064.1 N-6 DNA methylase [Aphanizomenon sp. PH219]